MSGVGGEVTEADELLTEMREAREEQATQRNERHTAIREREAKKLDAGARIVAMATRDGPVVLSDDDGDEENDAGSDGVERKDGKNGSCKKKKRRIVNHGQMYEGEMERFGSLLKEGEEAQRQLDEEKLNLEKRKFEAEENRRKEERADRRREREEERKERMEEREARDRLELQKFKLMMDMFKDQSGK